MSETRRKTRQVLRDLIREHEERKAQWDRATGTWRPYDRRHDTLAIKQARELLEELIDNE